MVSFIALAFLAVPVVYCVRLYRSFRHHLAIAKASNIPYIITPVYYLWMPWLLTVKLWTPLLRKLPQSWTDPWLGLLSPDCPWELRFTPFHEIGAGAFLTVSPVGSVLWVADASAISQITTRRNDFPKPTHLYGSLDLYGKNVLTTEGQAWRTHRKITGPPFTEKNNRLVWSESIRQARAMISSWNGPAHDDTKTIRTLADDTMRLTLHVISLAGFGVRMEWSTDAEVEAQESRAKGHTMSYQTALATLLHNVILVMLTPRFLLKRLPFKITKKAYEAFSEWGLYENEMFQAKKAEIAAGQDREVNDLLSALVKCAGITKDSATASSFEKGEAGPKQLLTDDEILGNIFVFIVAGHETTAGATHGALLYLALNVASQRRLQEDLDKIFGDKPISEWDYERDIPKLFGGMAGAILNEELRLLPAVTGIPKSTLKDSPQPIILDGKKCTVPADTLINLDTVAAHRNPRYWPAGPPSDPANPAHPTSNTGNDLEEFKPERWLIDAHVAKLQIPNGTTMLPDSAGAEELGVDAPDTASSLFHPPSGSYIPFSYGSRSCIGRRFGQVEVLAVLAVIFSEYSVELAVDEFASDEEVSKMNESQKREVWGKAHKKATKMMRDDMGSILTLQLQKGHVPLRCVKRGSERFDYR